MSAAVTLSSKLEGDEMTNGLDAYAGWLEEHPDEFLVAVVWIDCPKVTINTETGDHVPTARIRRAEPLGTGSDIPKGVRAAVDEALEKRTGRTPIPFDIVTVKSADPDGDELPDA